MSSLWVLFEPVLSRLIRNPQKHDTTHHGRHDDQLAARNDPNLSAGTQQPYGGPNNQGANVCPNSLTISLHAHTFPSHKAPWATTTPAQAVPVLVPA